MERFTDEDVRAWLESHLPDWRLEDGVLTRTYRTGDWRRTLLLTGGIAFLAEAAQHHPDLELSYPRVTVRLTTHDAGGITARDLELARLIEERATWAPGDDSVFEGPPQDWIG